MKEWLEKTKKNEIMDHINKARERIFTKLMQNL